MSPEDQKEFLIVWDAINKYGPAISSVALCAVVLAAFSIARVPSLVRRYTARRIFLEERRDLATKFQQTAAIRSRLNDGARCTEVEIAIIQCVSEGYNSLNDDQKRVVDDFDAFCVVLEMPRSISRKVLLSDGSQFTSDTQKKLLEELIYRDSWIRWIGSRDVLARRAAASIPSISRELYLSDFINNARLLATKVTSQIKMILSPSATESASKMGRNTESSYQEMEYMLPNKSLTTAYILWFFLGLFGGHRFYLRKPLSACGFIILTVTSLLPIIGVLTTVAAFVWLLTDAFLMPKMVRGINR